MANKESGGYDKIDGDEDESAKEAREGKSDWLINHSLLYHRIWDTGESYVMLSSDITHACFTVIIQISMSIFLDGFQVVSNKSISLLGILVLAWKPKMKARRVIQFLELMERMRR